MAEDPADRAARLAAIAYRLAELRQDEQFYTNMIDRRTAAHRKRRRWAKGIGIGIGVASAGLGFVLVPWVGAMLAAGGVAVPLLAERQDRWDRRVVALAEGRLQAIELEANALADEARRLRLDSSEE